MFWLFGFNTAGLWWHWVIVLGLIGLDFFFLAKACEEIPTGTVYAIFAAAGSIGAVLMDTWLFGVSFVWSKGLFIGLLVLGVISLHLADAKENKGGA